MSNQDQHTSLGAVVKCDNPMCNSSFEVSNFLGGHTFTCNKCGSRVTIRDLSSTRERTAREITNKKTPTLDMIVAQTYRSNVAHKRRLWLVIVLLFTGFILAIFFFTKPIKVPSMTTNAEVPPARLTSSDVEQSRIQKTFSRPVTGRSLVKEQANRGHGKLTIENGNLKDACVILKNVANGSGVRMIYIRSNNSAVLKALSPGNYEVLVSEGNKWDSSSKKFTEDAKYYRFGRILTFEEHQDNGNLHFSAATITLHSTAEGNVRPRQLSSNDFRP